MSKEMKDFLNQFMTQAESKPAEIIQKKEIKAKKETAKPITEAKTTQVKEPKKKYLDKMTNIMTDAPTNEGRVGVTLAAETFLQTINTKNYAFERKKNLQIDDQLFNVLNLLKQHEGIKSIATLLNAIVEKYIEDNKEDLKQILSKNPLG
jgi:vacuolar-type H+-ATPase subunit H